MRISLTLAIASQLFLSGAWAAKPLVGPGTLSPAQVAKIQEVAPYHNSLHLPSHYPLWVRHNRWRMPDGTRLTEALLPSRNSRQIMKSILVDTKSNRFWARYGDSNSVTDVIRGPFALPQGFEMPRPLVIKPSLPIPANHQLNPNPTISFHPTADQLRQRRSDLNRALGTAREQRSFIGRLEAVLHP